ncbi:hypothetical protein N657DRAFT_679019 [Parathielavia appendiculata]|uniref:RING-type E3 ubiquitin transferase n=1 Tax=Parathielavia appendiculata TaxID=2587402 RepID=A0AAN6Z5I5_9PEZI|nr:hypothetical protein N657DRAFT_679019 [Parathielavia appendiculata]
MASTGGNHLSAAAGREVVFCHACQNEWYRDEHDALTCPSCESSFTEIVDFSNDPRPTHGMLPHLNLSGRSSPFFHRSGGSDSDPDEGDIEEHLHSEPRFPFGSPNPGRYGAQTDRERANAMEGDAILRRFADMLMNDFGAGRQARGGPGLGGNDLFTLEEHIPQPGTRIQRTTFRAGPFGGSTSVTISSGTLGSGPQGAPPNFATLFDQIFGNPWGAGADEARQRERGAPAPGLPFPGALHDLLHSLYNPANAVHGDAVFSQEALDRIITQLMEASPQTNAAPPASQTAIENLEKKRVDAEMLGAEGKAECTICIDGIHKGDEVTVLPCKHWYHGECVVLWLKEHNTCPICRMPIENREGSGNSSNDTNTNRNGGPSQQPQNSQDPQPASASASTSASASASSSYPSSFSSFTARPPRPERERDRERPLRSARENLERLNAIRNLAGAGPSSSPSSSSEPQQPPRSGSHRRNSRSPPGAWPSLLEDAESASRAARVRSPSASSRERQRERDRDRGWERDRWSRMGWGEGPEAGRRGSPREDRDRELQQQQQQQQGGNGGADHDLSVTDHDPSAPLEGDLGRELTELRTLRAQLAELAKDVSAREKWLAATAVSGTTVTDLSSPITDCDSLPCALRAILRKTKYSLSAVFTNYDDDESDESNEHNRTATVIPLPPWRRKLDQNATGDADGHVDGDSDSSSSANSSSSSSSSSSADGEGFDLRHPAHALFAVLLAMSLLLALLRSLASLAVSVCCGERCDGLLPLATEPCRSRGESRRRWGWAWERVWECWRKCPRTSEGRIRLGEEVEAGNGDWDEKRGFGDRDQCEKYWDEMRAECLGEYGTPYADADEQGPCYAAREYLVSEDQVLVLEGDNERRVEGRGDSQGRRDSLDSPPSSLCVSESSNLGDEIASFRLAVELVEGMFAASEEQRDREM